jgi:hypothetical protein
MNRTYPIIESWLVLKAVHTEALTIEFEAVRVNQSDIRRGLLADDKLLAGCD